MLVLAQTITRLMPPITAQGRPSTQARAVGSTTSTTTGEKSMSRSSRLLFMVLMAVAGQVNAINLDACRPLLRNLPTDTNSLWQYGADFSNSIDALNRERRGDQANRALLLGFSAMVIRKEAFSLATLTAFYDFLDSNLQKEDSVKSLLTKSIFDYFDNMKDTLNYAEKVAPLITDSSLRDDAKNIIRELRRLQSSYGACQY
jgi:hypothetical protein